ncbi:porin [Rhodobacteraceae bacterium D3-12]|nr:porin [Rhodobacteraceae bacterium D3-12]
MKKILFATTALVATASVAAADVSFSGYGRFGAMDNGTTSGIYSRIRLQIDMSTEADNGLEFGARLRYQATSFNGAGTINTFNAARFYAKAGGFELGVGNIQGAIEWMPGLYMSTQSAGVGLSGHTFSNLVTNTQGKGYWGWDAYSSGGAGAAARNGVEVKYSVGDFGGHLSHSGTGATERTALVLSYKFNDWTVALGYQDANVAAQDKVVLTVGGKIGPANIGLAYADNDGIGKFGISANVEVGAATRVDVFITSEDGAAGGETYGLGVSHSLGGGASLEAGVERDDTTGTGGVTSYDLGIRFNF